MHTDNHQEACTACGEQTLACPCGIPAVCERCAVGFLPNVIAHAVLACHKAGSLHQHLHRAARLVEIAFWKAAACHLVGEPAGDLEDDPGDMDVPAGTVAPTVS